MLGDRSVWGEQDPLISGIYAGINPSAPCPSHPTRTQQDCIIYEPRSGIASRDSAGHWQWSPERGEQTPRFVNRLNFTVICSRLDLKIYKKEWILREKAKSIPFNCRIPKLSGVCICCRTHGTKLQSVFRSWCRGRPSDTLSAQCSSLGRIPDHWTTAAGPGAQAHVRWHICADLWTYTLSS